MKLRLQISKRSFMNQTTPNTSIGIIGGTGFYDIDGLKIIEEISINTPFGTPSAPIKKVTCANKTIYFLPRHGCAHQLLPHEVNYRANIYALKSLGVKQVLGFSAVGSLQESLKPGEFAIPDQYIDWIKGNRERSFFGNGIAAHISTAIPTCPDLTHWIKHTAETLDIPLHTNKTYICVDGPRLGTKAESHLFRQFGCDLVGMTNVPEVFLAREAQLCYATIGIITDYDCWMNNPDDYVTVATVIERFGKSLSKAKSLLMALLNTTLPETDETYRQSLQSALLTKETSLNKEQIDLLNLLRS